MTRVVKLKKGLTINLKGKAEKIVVKAEPSERYAVKPTDFHGVMPKLLVKIGDAVKIGDGLFFDKNRPNIKITSPTSGKVIDIVRGERRKILEIIIESDNKEEYNYYKPSDPEAISRQDIIDRMLESGVWATMKQRPFNIIANPNDIPKAIVISAFDTAPLAPDYDFIMQDNYDHFRVGLLALQKLTDGVVHLNVNGSYPPANIFAKAPVVQINKFTGKHPVGNPGIQIHHLDPINKGEIAWVVNPQHVLTIGRLFLEGRYDPSKTIALAGSEVVKPKYYKTTYGASIKNMVAGNIKKGNKPRYISGNVLTGSKINEDGYIGFYDDLVTVIPEGDHYEMFGWATPGFGKFSQSRSFWSWLTPNKEYKMDTNFHGGPRALMITGKFEQVFPMDIFPMQLIKAIIVEDIDLMEKLGIYEVAEEDFALCEFVDTSKTEIQEIIRNGLDLMVKEMS
ncbi:MAG: Na(+)-translocating NADH-quinone reductase subunit A [Bacteroidales bacterium]|nr:Na(+)-translocating NADH-quinone reductase subunit A [Bacteroidales bacterium]